jgi:hypothetical protein
MFHSILFILCTIGEHFEYLGRTFSGTGPTGGTFGIIHKGDPFIHGDTLFRAVFHTGFAFYTPGLTGLLHHSLDGIPVGTEGHSPLAILGNIPEKLLGTFRHTTFTPGTFRPINMG